MSAGLTRTQSKILRFIGGFAAEHGHAPSLQEIASGLGLRSRGNVCQHVRNLAARGAIRTAPGRSRSITIISGALQLGLPPDLDRELRQVAAAVGVSRESVALEALRNGLSQVRSYFSSPPAAAPLRGSRRPTGPDAQELGDQVLGASGSLRQGVGRERRAVVTAGQGG